VLDAGAGLETCTKLLLEDLIGVDDAMGVDDLAGVDDAIGVDDLIGVDDAIGVDDLTGVDETTGVDDLTGVDDATVVDDLIGVDDLTGVDEAIVDEAFVEEGATDELVTTQPLPSLLAKTPSRTYLIQVLYVWQSMTLSCEYLASQSMIPPKTLGKALRHLLASVLASRGLR
jgi:hypothetical protein